ncbi:MAG: hypothetical protein QNJ31_03505 [Candidatus Caenarcaniphilales bacterium]|nr:hypothetical protein [Candidatus Caenarcaniphilales bacterium]
MFNKLLFLAFLLLCSNFSVDAKLSIKSTKSIKPDASKKDIKKYTYKSNNLKLSKQLKEQAQALENEQNVKLSKIRPEIKNKKKEIQSELTKENPDIEKLEFLNKQLFALKEKNNLIKLNYHYELSKIFTIQQRKDYLSQKSIQVTKLPYKKSFNMRNNFGK